MSEQSSVSDRFWPLLNDACDGMLTDSQMEELETILGCDRDACRVFLDHILLQANIRFLERSERICNLGLAGVQAAIPQTAWVPPPTFVHAPVNLRGPIGLLSSDWPVAYLVATVIFAIGAIVGVLTHVSQPAQVALESPSGISRRVASEQAVQGVGRITAMVDCKWAAQAETGQWRADSKQKSPSSRVGLGDQFNLVSGLLEISYDSGATVVLQGPAEYKVDSNAGGFLAVGKLVARAENKSEGRDGSASDSGGSSTVGLRQSAGRSLPAAPTARFTVNTPTVTVADLGTEFTVEVQKSGVVNVCVLEGEVETSRRGHAKDAPIVERITAGRALRFASAAAASEEIKHAPTSSAIGMPQAIYRARKSSPLLASNVLATAYHRVWSGDGASLGDDRHRAFLAVTDSVVGRGQDGLGPRSSFDTLSANGPATDFVGLLYDQQVRIDRIKVCLGRQFADGGSWQKAPRVFILKSPVDTNQTPPESDPAHWRELPGHLIYGRMTEAQAEANPGQCLEFVLTDYSNEARTGYGWAVGGVPGSGSAGYVSVTQLFAFGSPLQNSEEMATSSIAHELAWLGGWSMRAGGGFFDDFDGSSLNAAWTATLPTGEGWCLGTGATSVDHKLSNSQLVVSRIEGSKRSALQNVWALTRPLSDVGDNPFVASLDFRISNATAANDNYHQLKLLDSKGYLIAGVLATYGSNRTMNLYLGFDFNDSGRGSFAPRDVNNESNVSLSIDAVYGSVARLAISRDAINRYRLKVYAGPSYDRLALLRDAYLGRVSRNVAQFQIALAGSASPPMAVDRVGMIVAQPTAREVAADVLFSK